MIMGQILNDCIGDGAKKKLAKRRINIISSNVNSYSRLVNSEEQLKNAVEVNGIAALLGEIRADADEERAAKAAKTKANDFEKAQRKNANAAAFTSKKEELQPALAALAEGLVSGALSIDNVKNGDLVNLLKYFFEASINEISKLKREGLMENVLDLLENYKACRVAV